MTDTATVEMTVAEAIEQGLVIPTMVDPLKMTDQQRFFVEDAAHAIEQVRFYDEMEAKLGPIQEAHVPFPYGTPLSAADLGGIGNLLMGARGIIHLIAMLPEETRERLGYPEWERAAVDAAEMKAAAEACYAERQRRLQGS